MKKILPLLLLCLSVGAKAQFIDNKLDLYFSVNHYLNSGNTHLLEKEDFIVPSLFGNMKTIHSFSVKGLYAYRPFISVGVGLEVTKYSGWAADNYDHYKGSSIREVVIAPVVQFHPERRDVGFLNRFKPNIQLSPLIGLAQVDFLQPPFQVISSPKPDMSSLLSSSDVLFGLKASLGIEMIVNRFIGFTANGGIRNSWVSSVLYQDKWILQPVVDAGLYVRLFKNKRFYY